MTTPTQADRAKAAAEEIHTYCGWKCEANADTKLEIILRHFPESENYWEARCHDYEQRLLNAERLCALRALSAADAGAKALQELTDDQLRFEQQEIRDAHAALSQLNAPTNGAEGEGKRQSLSLAQRIAHLPAADVIAKARAVVEAAFYATTVPNNSAQLRVKHMIVDLSTALDKLDASRKE